MKRWGRLGLVVLTITHFAWAKDSSTDSDQWLARMKLLGRVLPELLADLDTPPALYTNKQRARIRTKANQFLDLAHEVSEAAKKKNIQFAPAHDPGVGFLAAHLEKEARRAVQAIQSNHWEYGSRVLKSVTGYCVSCHTRGQTGKHYPKFDFGKITARMTPMEKAELAAATRQFDAAFTQFRSLLLDPKFAKSEPINWLRALKYALGISVRYQEDPNATLALLDDILKYDRTPFIARRNVNDWRKSAHEWKQDLKSKKKSPSVAVLLQESRGLLKAGQARQSYPADHSGDIEFLRLSSTTHQILEKSNSSKIKAEALYLSGVAYQALDFPDLWSLHESYFEQCIREVPHTRMAKQCYERLENSVIDGFTGSAGTSIPNSIENYLRELEKQAKPRQKPKRKKG